VADPGEKIDELADEMATGRSERTPFLVLGSVYLTLLAAFVVICAIAFAAYLLA